METLSKKLEYELSWLWGAYGRGSRGIMYIPTAKEGTYSKKAFIRLKRLVAKNMAHFIENSQGKPVYAITPRGIDYALTHQLPKY